MNFNIWTAKISVAFTVFIKTIKYYDNTNCTLKKGKKKSAQLSCVEVLHVNVGFFYAQLKCTANGISVLEYILTNFMLYERGNFKNVTIYIWQYIHILHWYSVCGAFQLGVKKSYIYVKNFNTWQLCGFFFTFL
jgi:hypothetical protein